MPSWETVFMPSTSLLELIMRGTVIYLAVFVLMRIAGRREVGQVSMPDLVLIVLISEAASVGIGGDADSILDGIVLVTTIVLWSVALDVASYRWPRFGALVKPKARLLIIDGELQLRVMRREFLSKEEVLSQLRLNDVQDVSEVHRAYVESNGMISVVPKKES